ncbi:hypothetical protein MU852_14700 [Brevundimonas albigilva]|nr:hypothetical protein [Brevundimonas albigilva]UQV18008.1 hypothetical protein MU852_14700 [Brevundimonas albigilva]
MGGRLHAEVETMEGQDHLRPGGRIGQAALDRRLVLKRGVVGGGRSAKGG